MAPHLLRVTQPVVKFEELVAALRHAGDRVGWLDLGEVSGPPPAPLPEELSEAADLGVLRAVAVAGGRLAVVKPLRGAPVLRDLLREHFRGCRLVLVRGDLDAPTLEPDGEGWRVARDDEKRSWLATDQLVARLRRPRPFDQCPSAQGAKAFEI